jgi:predicted transcriptional regulator
MEERRSKMRIYLDMLNTIIRKGGTTKPTHIMYGANLSHDRLKTYLNFLLEKGFIEEVNVSGRIYYQVTEKGKQFIIEFRKVNELSEAFGIEM